MRIIVGPGDGIGPEITAATVAVLEAVDEALALDLRFEQRAIEFATDELILNSATRTPDLGGPLGTAEFASALCERVGRAPGSG